MKILKNLVLSAAVAVSAVACGGGGGSPGETHAPYQITLRAERTQLPININNVGPGIGAYAPYTTVLTSMRRMAATRSRMVKTGYFRATRPAVCLRGRCTIWMEKMNTAPT